jgi:dTDP-4-dehydrorhamnose 3,5-epimerase-like enzyme
MNNKNIKIINVDASYDDRGEVVYCNEFNFIQKKIERFYQITNNNLNFVRAWHGHKNEEKFLLVTQGAFKICAVKIDNWKNPSKRLSVKEFVINANSPKILHIPGGYAHGTQNLKIESKLMVFSTFSTKQSIQDDYRFKSDLWYNWNIQFR